MGPKNIPGSVVQKVAEAVKKATDEPEFKEVLKKLDMAILYQKTEDYEKFVRQDFENIGKVVKALGLDKK